MTSLDTAIKAFQQSHMTFDELMRNARLINTQNADVVAEARHQLEQAYHQGQLPAQVYWAVNTVFSDATRVASAQAGQSLQDNDDATVVVSNRTATPRPEQASRTMPTTQLNTESLLEGLRNDSTDTALAIGSTIKNRFVLEQLLGVGGMGMVFKATDLRKVEAADKDPFVALKVLNQDFKANPMALVSLQRETKRAQTLAHPNIIKVFDFDRDGGHVFMSMEYLEGRPLSHLIKDHPNGLPFKQAWPVIHAMADALSHAHKKNIAHSDFKPGNVFIDDSDEVRVLDFGIACAIGRSDKDRQDATIFNARALGAMTPAYASLEQLQNRDPDPRDDIYALACVSYELLTGKHPFGKLSAEKAKEVSLQVKPVAKLPRRQWKGLQKALAFDQQNRTASIKEFIKTIGPRSTVFYTTWVGGTIAAGFATVGLYFSVIAPPTVVEVPKVAVDLNAEQKQKVADLLELAGIHNDVGYLTAPTGSNALWAYQEVLKIDPYNKQAMDGIIKIADTLEQHAWEAYEKNDKTSAMKKIQEGLDAHPTHKGLLRLLDKLRDAM